MGLKLRNRIIWHFGHGLHASNRFSGRYETILWFTKSDDYIFNLDNVRIPSKYPGKLHYKGPNKGKPSGNPLGKNPSDVWEILQNDWDNCFWEIPNVKSNHPEKTIHPCQFPIELVERCVLALTNEDSWVLDPFGGVGSTAKACEIEGRICTSIELQKKWHDLAIKRLETEISEGASKKHNFILGDSREILRKMDANSFDFMITSPPYWSILNKKADYKVKKERLANNLATNYSDDKNDLANIESYKDFLDILVNEVFLECGRVLKPKKYMCIVVSDFRNKSEFISFHSDLIQSINHKRTADGYTLTLQGVKVLLQNHKTLLPYGYPFAYVENIHHQYVLIFRKEK